MSGHQRTIPELRAKLNALMRSEIAQAVGGYVGNVNSFGEATIGREAMRNHLNPTGKKSSTVSAEHEGKIADRCKFRIDMTQWQTGTAAEFIAEYERLHKRTSVSRLTDVPLAKAAEIEPEPSRIPGLVAIQAFVAQYGKGRADIGFELSCGRLKGAYGVTINIRSGILELRCFPAGLVRETRKGFDKPWSVDGSQGAVGIEWSAGTTFSGRWRLTASGAMLGNIDVPPSFVTLESLAPGDEVEIRFAFRPKDTARTIDLAALQFDDGAASGDDVSIDPPTDAKPQIDPGKLSEVKQAILARLATEALVDEGDGIVVHARHRVGFVAAVSVSENKNG